jgi:hypothetical protein
MSTFHSIVAIANAFAHVYLFICAMNAPRTRRIMISKYLLTLVYNRLNNVSKLRVLYWYTGICTESDGLQEWAETWTRWFRSCMGWALERYSMLGLGKR